MAIATDFSNRTALITGAASGIGAACAQWLAAQGVGKLILVDRDEAALETMELACETVLHSGDVGDPALWERVEASTDAINHAVVNAGIANGGMIRDFAFEEWRRILGVNLDGAFLTLRSAMRLMQGSGGSAVLLASVAGIKPVAGASAYGVSKAALIHLAKIAALEGAPQKIRVNAIAPGGVDTPIWNSNPEFNAMVEAQGRDTALGAMASATPSKRFATADEIAATIGFLLSDAADNITGAVLSSDGGYAL